MQPIHKSPSSRLQTLDHCMKTEVPRMSSDVVKIIAAYDGPDVVTASKSLVAPERDMRDFIKTPEFREILAAAAQVLSTSSEECSPLYKRSILQNFCRYYIVPGNGEDALMSLGNQLFGEMAKLKLTVNLDRTDLTGLEFSHCCLNRMSAVGADLTRTRFRHCDLRGVNFSAAVCESSKFFGCNLQDMNLTDARWSVLHFYWSCHATGLISNNSLLNSYLHDYAAKHWFMSWITGIRLEGTFNASTGMLAEFTEYY